MTLWADRVPDRHAINEHGLVATYGEVVTRAREFHAALLAHGRATAGPVVVASASTLVGAQALLGILRAGRTYVPVDPAWPAGRIADIVTAAGSRLAIADAGPALDAMACVASSCRTLGVDEFCSIARRGEIGAVPDADVLESAFKWIIFTSGSSGTPKGVVQPHANVIHYAKGICRSLRLTEDDRIGMMSPLTAHGGLVYALASLLCGASLYPIDPRRLTPSATRAWIDRHRISVLFLVPTALRAMVDTRTIDTLSSVRLLRLTGEPVQHSDIELYRRHFADDCVLSVGFGSTETGGICESFFGKDAACASTRVPVGAPVLGVQVGLHDEHGHDVGTGRPGEFVVRGEHLSPGYWNDPQATAARFTVAAGGREFRTGDIGIRRADGMFEHMGRADAQVQISGQRVELGEIETALMRVDGVGGAAVVDVRDALGRPRLVAYYHTAAGASAVDPAALRQRLVAELPFAMIPARLVAVDSLPSTSSGKVDRRRLSALAAELPTVLDAAPRPATALERALTELSANVLGVDRVGLGDNFFELGGNSILAAALFVQVEARLGYRAPLAALAEAPTMEALAAYLERSLVHQPRSCLVPMQPLGPRPPFFCLHGWGGNAVGFHALASHLGNTQPFFGVQSKGLFDIQHADRSVEEMAATYIEEILARWPDGPILLGGLSSGGLVAYEMARQLWARGRPVALLALFDTAAPTTTGSAPRRWIERGDRLRERIGFHLTHLFGLPPSDRRVYVRRRLHTARRKVRSRLWRWGVGPPRSKKGVAGIWSEVREINYLAFRRYRLQPYAGKVTVFRAAEGSPGRSRDAAYGWRQFAHGGVDVHVVPGDHTSLITDPHVRALAHTLERCIDEALQEERRP